MPLIVASARAPSPAAARDRGRAVAAVPVPRLSHILLLAMLIRVALLLTPRSYFPDEIFQYLEPAHRLVFGTAIVPWEYRFGIRSWLPPVLLAGPMALGGWLAPGTGAYLLLPKLCIASASLGTVWAAHALGGRISPRHGLFAAFVAAIWSETALFSTQALTEAIAVAPILAGAALLGPDRRNGRRMIAAGALLALGVVLRFQFGPAVAVLGVIACGRSRRCWALAAAGGVAVVIAAGLFDLAMGGRPFAWIVENFHQNIGLKRSHAWTDGPSFYPLAVASAFGIALLPAWMAAREVYTRYPELVAAALVNLATHTLIAHKEYRYLLLSTTILIVLAGIGTIDLVHAARRRWAWVAPWHAALGWIALSLLTGVTGYNARFWSRVTPELHAFAALRTAPRLCGIAIVGDYWADSGGYAYLHRAVPIYVPDDSDVAPATWVPAASAGFDTIMAPARLASALPPGFARTACFGDGRACLYRRPGACVPAAAAGHEINRVLVRTDR